MATIIDLTLPLRATMRGVAFEPAKTLARDGWNARTLHLYSHAGTHMDAPTHFGAGPGTIDRVPLARCLLPAHVVSLPDLAPRALLTLEHLGALAATFPRGEGLLLRTGWSRHVDNPALYRDGLPRIGEELACWCVERGVGLLGVEPPSIADVNHLEEVTAIHRILLGSDILIVEGLANLDALKQSRVLFGALPLPIADGDGCPCRAFAIEGVLPELLSADPAE